MYQLLVGDVREQLRTLPYGSVHCVVTSPPYFGLRDYGHAGQIGLEQTPDEYVAKLVDVFRDVWRVLRDDGTLWLNLGDSYAGAGYANHKINGQEWYDNANLDKRTTRQQTLKTACLNDGIKPKDLVGIPWRVAFALQADGWYLRSDIIWHKPNPMPESVTDRPTKAHEYLFLLAKSPHYFYDAEAIKEESVYGAHHAKYQGTYTRHKVEAMQDAGAMNGKQYQEGLRRPAVNPFRKNKRSVWTITTKPFKGAHFAVMPEKLVEPCVLAGTSDTGVCIACGKPWERVVARPGVPPPCADSELDRFGTGKVGVHRKVGQKYQDFLNAHPVQTIGWKANCDCPFDDPTAATVLDPFAGSCTTGVVALKHGRNFIGIELNRDYATLGRNRLDSSVPPSVF